MKSQHSGAILLVKRAGKNSNFGIKRTCKANIKKSILKMESETKPTLLELKIR